MKTLSLTIKKCPDINNVSCLHDNDRNTIEILPKTLFSQLKGGMKVLDRKPRVHD